MGRCIVNVPKGHVPGSTGSAWWIKLVKGDDELKVVSLAELNPSDYWQAMTNELSKDQENSDDKAALFFLHGYNVTFEDAAIRTAQLAYDLRIQPAVFFSWPSAGVTADYLADEDAITISYDAVTEFVLQLDAHAIKAGATLHIVAHSMGNRALLKALEAVATGLGSGAKSAIKQLVFAAPDVDSRLFLKSLEKIEDVGQRKTLYASAKDKAVWISKSVHKNARAGLLPPVTIAAGFDTIDASGVDDTFLGHGYIASVRALIADLGKLFSVGSAPNGRTGVEPETTEAGENYWRIV